MRGIRSRIRRGRCRRRFFSLTADPGQARINPRKRPADSDGPFAGPMHRGRRPL
ncbi:hypothetical protein [Lysobacter gummosus]|uniref:hypothetical protein n=1 Tax=Lysobacter gummosus TaxID=262324 RepID=UPI003640D93C